VRGREEESEPSSAIDSRAKSAANLALGHLKCKVTNRNARSGTECRHLLDGEQQAPCGTVCQGLQPILNVTYILYGVVVIEHSLLRLLCCCSAMNECQYLRHIHIRQPSFCCCVKWTGNRGEIDRNFMFRVMKVRDRRFIWPAEPSLATASIANSAYTTWW
jgi:hypothetical protein